MNDPARARLALLLIALHGVLVVLGIAGVRPGMPMWPARVESVDLARLQSTTSTLQMEDGALRMSGADLQGRTAAWTEVDPFELSEQPLVRVHIEGAGPLDLVKLLLNIDGEYRAAVLPGHGQGVTVVDPHIASFQTGRVTGLGLLVTPAEILPVGLAAPLDLRLLGIGMETPSVSARLRVLWQSWFGYRSWIGRSINTAGSEHGSRPLPGIQTALALWLAGALPVALLLRPRCWRRWAAGLLGVALFVSGLLAAAGNLLRAEVAWRAAGRVAEVPEASLSAMPWLHDELAALASAWRDRPPERVLVWGDSKFMREYPGWVLREFNVNSSGSLDQLLALPSGQSAMLVLVGVEGWDFDPISGVLRLADRYLPARLEQLGEAVHVFRLRGRGASP